MTYMLLGLSYQSIKGVFGLQTRLGGASLCEEAVQPRRGLVAPDVYIDPSHIIQARALPQVSWLAMQCNGAMLSHSN